MATLAFAAAGAAIGSAALPAGVSLLGTTLTGAALGTQIGAIAGSFVDQALFGATGQPRALKGPRLSDLTVTASTEGAPIPRVYGRVRVGGQIIWATDHEEEVVTEVSGGSGGKGGGSSQPRTTSTSYVYYANFAVALAEGPVRGIGRVWADGEELDLSAVAYRFYPGDESQLPDALISSREGAARAPAFRGIAYVVFERLALAPFANRVPQLAFEVFRAVDAFNDEVRAVVMIPGSGEFVYAGEPVTRGIGGSARVPENVHQLQAPTDWTAALDQLEASLPNVAAVSLMVSWFGNDLRAAQCEVYPAAERNDKETEPLQWSVAGLTRAQARTVSVREGRPAYGGTPSDQTVVAAIRDLAARGMAVTLTPFVLMDVPEGSALPNPYDPPAGQPAYPWRGRITTSVAPGLAGTPDKTAAAAAEVAAFIGTAAPVDFALSGDSVVYSGPEEWSYRRCVLHNAYLAKAAGGVEAFLIGTELRGLTQIRDGASSYPFVAALVALAADVKAVLGAATKVGYAADWSEYFGHQPADGTGDVHFHLDPLWSAPDIDFIGLDLYWPLADWRTTAGHLDQPLAVSIYDPGYLKSNIAGGEGYDWYYASPADRAAQVRTPITDGAGKAWVFRYKDLAGWWSSPHFDRPGGVEAATPTAWVPGAKPFRLMEIGCPAVDLGANQPNVFVDPKSSESFLPYFSRGNRDDLMQRRYIQSLIEGLDPAHEGHVAGTNPLSPVYGGAMIDVARTFVYAWDARPYPAFPNDGTAWGDAPNWHLGHWLTGRVAGMPLSAVVEAIARDYGFDEVETGALAGVVTGYQIDRLMSAREALQQLELAYFFDAVESGGRIVFRHRGGGSPVAAVTGDGAVEERPGAPLVTRTRGQETELPGSAKLTYIDGASDYRQAVAEARRVTGASARVAEAAPAIVMAPGDAERTAATLLFEAWAARERVSLILPPSLLAVEAGDMVEIGAGAAARRYRITEVRDRGARQIEALSVDPSVYEAGRNGVRVPGVGAAPIVHGPDVAMLDLPLLRGDEAEDQGHLAAWQAPWRGPVALYASADGASFALRAVATRPAIAGRLIDALPPGPQGRLDRAHRPRVELDAGSLASIGHVQMLGGGNVAAVGPPGGPFEIVQFERADLVGERNYLLSGLLRAQAGTDDAMAVGHPEGARFVLIDRAVTAIGLASSEIGLPFQWRAGPADRDIAHPSFAALTHAFAGRGRRPFSPAHVRGRRNAGGDLELTWIRRTRRGGDSWDSEPALAEDVEAYEVDIMAEGAVVRSLATGEPRVVYAAGDQLADFGVLPSQVEVRVHQLSATVGRGTARSAVV